jgi:type I restriction enzyme S subunit
MTDLPVNWTVLTLKDVAKWGSGGTPRAGTTAFYGGNIPWAVIGDLTEGMVDSTAATITEEGLNSSSAKIVPRGTVLIAMYGASIGRTGIAAIPVATNQAIAFAQVHESMMTNTFLFHYLASQKHSFVHAGIGAAQPNISQTILKAWSVPVPPIAEQQLIVGVLEEQFSRLDIALESVRVVRDKAKSFRRSLLRHVFNSVSDLDSNTDWEISRLADLGRWYGGGTPSKSNADFWTDGDLPWLSPKDMKGTLLSDTEDHITRVAVSQSSVRLVPPESIAVVVRSGILERCLPIALVPFETTLNQDMKAVVPREGVLAKWILYALQANEQEILVSCRKSGTTVASIEWSRFAEFEVPLVPLDRQIRIVAYLDGQFSRLDAYLDVANGLEARISSQRRSSLHAAFTGSLTARWRETQDV